MSTTLTTLRTRVRHRVQDAEGYTHTDDALDNLINESKNWASRWLMSLSPEVFRTTVYAPLTANSERYTLPTDLVTLHLLEIWNNQTLRYEQCKSIALEEKYLYERSSGDYLLLPSGVFVYFLEENSLVLIPTPSYSQTDGIKLTYDYLPADLTTSNPLSGKLESYQDIIILKAALLSRSITEDIKQELTEDLQMSMDVIAKTLYPRAKDRSRRIRIVKYYR